ncbi:hypothetical protein M3Y99_00340400 [Aphelenchoides fujianensis]|nr:hypothetical protein M3Y99_00340400 [Aphelenchoides fujianensis]
MSFPASRKRFHPQQRTFQPHGKKFRPARRQQNEVVEFRKREGSSCSIPEDEGLEVPECPHGPCLFFTNGQERWFSCAVYRADDLCNYRVDVPVGQSAEDFEFEDARPASFTYGRGNLAELIKDPSAEIYWCSTCRFPLNGKKRRQLDSICGFLSTREANDGQAVVMDNLERFDAILSIGCPTIFDPTSSRPTEFAHFSMLNGHFFQPDGEERLDAFLSTSKRLAIVVDPPFGVFLSALQRTLEGLKERFLAHLNGLKLLDFKVTYANHPTFKRADKSIVRIFSDIKPKRFVLPVQQGYKFCEKCERYVSAENEHCDECEACTTISGNTYKHCEECAKCVKPSYVHCAPCGRCHLPNRCSR